MQKKHKKIIKNIIEVLFSNIATIISGVIVGFIIPKVLTVEGYGFYKTFTLYVTYTGMFSMGIIDGIVLEYGGYDYKDYDHKIFRGYFKWYILIHAVWSGVLIAVAFMNRDYNYRFIIIMIAIYMTFANVVGYFQQISQIAQRFTEYSIAKGLQSVMKIASGLLLIAIYVYTSKTVDYRIYTGLVTFEFIIVAIGYICIYKKIIWGQSESLRNIRPQVLHLSKIGIPLMIANLCSTLILTLDRQFVNLLFTNAEYAIYAFAYNLLSLITVATAAISTVLYPILKRTTVNTLKRNYSNLISIILVVVCGTLIVYFPLCKFIEWFLPRYVDSLPIFRIIFPGLAISSAVTVVMHNYYKTLGENLAYFRKSIIILAISGLLNAIAFIVFRNTISISAASIISMIVWYLYIEQFFVVKYGYSRKKNLFYLLFMILVFYGVTCIENWVIAAVIYFIIYIIIAGIIQKSVLMQAKKILKGDTLAL